MGAENIPNLLEVETSEKIEKLPYRYSDVKGLLVEKCGLAELILDNLVLEGTTKKVTVGVADEGDAAVLVRKVNGLYVDGLQLYVEDARKKRPGSEQPFRSTKEYKLSQEAQHHPHYGQATMMPIQMQPQYADPQAYMPQNPVLHTNSLAMQSPYMNTQPIMQGYGMAAGIDMVPQDNSMVGYQADDLPYQSGGLSDVPAQQPNWAAQNPNNQHWDQGQEYQKWSNSQQKNWDQDRSKQNQWVRNRSRSRSPARERSRHDTRSDSRRGKKSKQLTWEPRQGAKKDWHGRDGNAGTGYGRPPSPQRQRFSPQRRETSLQQPVDFNAREFRGNPDYLARHAPPEMLQQYEPDRNYSYEDLYQPNSSQPFEREDNDFPPNPAYFEPQDQLTPYGDHVKRGQRRSRSGDRSRSRFEGSSQSFRKRDERESWSDRKRPAPDRHEQFPNRAREHEFGAQDRRVQFPKRARENEFGAQDNRAGDRVYPVDKGKPGSKVAPGDYIPMRDRTWRAQTVSQIAKANALNETAKVVKYYKRAVSAKLDKLMRDEVNVSTGDMFLRYMQLHNDKKVLNACRRQVEMELKASSEERTADVGAALAGEKFKGAPAAKPNPKAGKQQPTAPKQQPNGPKTQPTAKKNSNITMVSGRIPNYPAGDKQIFKDAKKAMQMEFAGEMTYSLDAPEDQALESDLDNMTMLIKENCGASGEEASAEDNYVAKGADAIADELRTDGEIEGTQPSLATQPYPLENLAKLLQGHDEMNPKDSLYDLTDVMPSLAREPQTSKTLECEPPTIDETLEGQKTEKYAQISDKKRKRKRKKRSGVPRNGGSWKEWGRLLSCKSLKCLQAREGTGNVNEQDQAEQEVETQQGNQSGVGKNIRERNKKIVRKDNKLVQAEPSFVKPKEPKKFEGKMKTLELNTNIPDITTEVDHDEFVTIDEVKLEDKLCDQNDLTDRMPSQVFKPQLSEGLASQLQPLENLTNQSQLFEYLANHPQIFEYLATHPKVLKSLSNQPQLLECSVSKIEQRDLETLCVTIGNDRLLLNMLSLYRHILGQTDSDEDEYSISVDEMELGEIKPFESLTNQLQPSESLTSQVSSVTSPSQPVDGLISQPQPFESLTSEQPIESLVRVIDLTQLQTLKGPVTQSKLSQYLENQPQVSEYLANQPQLFECLANLQQIFECMPNRPQIFQYLANQPQLFQCLANQPQLFEYLTSQPQLLQYLANHPYPLQYLLSKVRVWDKNTLLETIDNDRSIMIAMSDQLKPKWRRKRKRRGAKRNRGSKTERGRLPSYRRRKKNDENSEEQHMKVKVEASGDTNNITGKGINEEESHLDQDVKTELSSSSQDEGEEVRMKKRRSSDEEVCGGNQQNHIVQSLITDNSISQVLPENNTIERHEENQIDDDQSSLASFSQATDQLLLRLASELQNSSRSEATGNEPQPFASQSQPFEYLENQPQLSESLARLQQPWNQIDELVVTMYKMKNEGNRDPNIVTEKGIAEEESNFFLSSNQTGTQIHEKQTSLACHLHSTKQLLESWASPLLNTGQTEVNGNELEDKLKRKRKRKRGKSKNKRHAGSPRNGGSRTEWGRLPQYKRQRKTLESTEQHNKQEAQSKQSKETQQNETEVDKNNVEGNKDIVQEVYLVPVQDGTNMTKQEDNNKQQDLGEIDKEEYNLDQDDEFDTASSNDESYSEDDSSEDSAKDDNAGIQSNLIVPTQLSGNSASQAQPENNTTERTKHNESVLHSNQQDDQTGEVLPSLASQLSEKIASQHKENPKSNEFEVQAGTIKRKNKKGGKRKPGKRTEVPRNGGHRTEWGRISHDKRREPYDNRQQAQGKQKTYDKNKREPGKHTGVLRINERKEEGGPSCERRERYDNKQSEEKQTTCPENEREPGKNIGAPRNDGRKEDGAPMSSCERRETYDNKHSEGKQRTYEENERELGKHTGASRSDGHKEERGPMSSCERTEVYVDKESEEKQTTYQEHERELGNSTVVPRNYGRTTEWGRSYERKGIYVITDGENKQKAKEEQNSETSLKENEIGKEEYNLDQDLEFDPYSSSQDETGDSDTADDEEIQSKLTVPSQLEKLAGQNKENSKSNEIEVQVGTIKRKKKRKRGGKRKTGKRTGVPRNGGHRTEWGRMPKYKRREPSLQSQGGQSTCQENEREPEKNNQGESMKADKEVKHKVTEQINVGNLSLDSQEFATSTTINIHRADNTDMITDIQLKQKLLTTADEIKTEPLLYRLVDQVESLPSLACEPQSLASQSDMIWESDIILATQPQPQEITIVRVRLEDPGTP